jgi:hypothetical protein
VPPLYTEPGWNMHTADGVAETRALEEYLRSL